ncbi:MAG: hypothetical protein IGS03_09400 [Candidatus Sericytochromatia bacterium]|nr:hypothetical protein [Candidatus Sericytochromatia bacterium]
MQALFNCRHVAIDFSPAWSGSAYLQPLCNRPLLEYWLDLCVWLGVSEVLLVVYPGEEALLEHVPDGSEWGLKLHTASGQPDDVLPDVLSRHARLLQHNLLVLDGPVFPYYNRQQLSPSLTLEAEPVIYTLDQDKLRLDFTVLLFSARTLQHLQQARNESERFQRWTSLPLDRHAELNFQILLPQSLRDYYILNLQVLNDYQRFQLKGFEVAPGVFEGLHNQIARRPALGGPLITGQACKLGPGVQLERSILHDQVRIEGETRLSNCMVWGPVYLADISLENRLIWHNQCIDPLSGQQEPLSMPWRLKTLLEDTARAQQRQSEHGRLASRLLLRRWPLYQLLKPWLPFELKKYYLNAHGEVLIVPEYQLPESPNPLQRLFFSQKLDRVPFLLAVRRGELALVGTRLLPARQEYLNYIQQLPIYVPGAFSHSEELDPENLTHWMEELHYCSQHSAAMDEAIWRESLNIPLKKA